MNTPTGRYPQFDELDVENWFCRMDVIFDQCQMNQLMRFSEAISLINHKASVLVGDLIANYQNDTDPYDKLKVELCSKMIYSKREAIYIVLAADKMNLEKAGMKPSAYVAHLNYLLRNCTMEDLKIFLLMRACPENLNVRVRGLDNAEGLARRLDDYFSSKGELL